MYVTVSGRRRHGQSDLLERLHARRAEVERSMLTRVYAISDPTEVGDPEYALGLRTAVTTALDYALASLDASEANGPPLPPELPAQARAAARNGVNLDTVLRRYLAGYTLLTDCLVREAQAGHADLPRAMRSQAELLDRLIAAVAEAYSAERRELLKTTERRTAERVKRLLRGDLVDHEDLGYPLEGWHLGVVGSGPSSEEAIRSLAEGLDCRLLVVRPGGEAAWAWLGARRALDSELVEAAASGVLGSAGPAIAIGEAGQGIAGWRASHRQAAVALPVAQRTGRGPVRYADVALLAAALHDEVLAESLRQLYLVPLSGVGDGGEVLRETLRAYFEAGDSVSSAASALGINRNTVASRLRAVEEALGRSLLRCGKELEVALHLEELQGAPWRPDTGAALDLSGLH